MYHNENHDKGKTNHHNHLYPLMGHIQGEYKFQASLTIHEWLVMLGICTHLGCVPLTDKGDYDGWFCPCHGSHYDTSGRIRKGPAPTNMEIPKYEFVNTNTIKIG